MAAQYINYIKAKTHLSKAPKAPAPEPVLTSDDEAFLQQVTSQAEGVGKDPQIALMDGAQHIPLPQSPLEDSTTKGSPEADDGGLQRSLSKESKGKGKKKSPWGWIAQGMDKRKKEHTAAGLSNIAENIKPSRTKTEEFSPDEVKMEQDDLTKVLERLNLSAVNNRIFSISDETQVILKKFNFILKDLINGVPTAYHDLESLLTNEDGQLQNSFNHLPGFLQKLIEQLPDKVTEKFAPEFLAMAAEKAGKSGISLEEATKTAEKAKSMGLKIPSLKELVGKPAAIAGMLRSIVGFLQARFPALMGMNVLMSLALFILLFVLWYCHKRGREVRLEKEKLKAEEQSATITNEDTTTDKDDNNTSEAQTTTTAATSAPKQGRRDTDEGEDRAGVRGTQDDARQAALLPPEPAVPTTVPITTTTTATTSTTVDNVSLPSLASEAENQTRRLPKVVQPYPGT
ncbi:hypothetical protein BDBG_03125 [Blastomyces gilchristii SLH14081]|uniref:RING-like domain-containing protein n=1 Tax=Blastomyces gilchristii (strain SLH14081) TaxID=559298 RepID=A0A179UID7_BLAGS|nr:uncharacterized protein BDBG_03125 [Blastomyces gilchristii SLH14081]OAT07018.1 hypothetical protein BDBG_03125 [Blastomyces gilchristii SLH14081]